LQRHPQHQQQVVALHNLQASDELQADAQLMELRLLKDRRPLKPHRAARLSTHPSQSI
jgi:hypothetical protein